MSHHFKPDRSANEPGADAATQTGASPLPERPTSQVVSIGSLGTILGRRGGADLPTAHDTRPITATMFGANPSITLTRIGDDDGGEAA